MTPRPNLEDAWTVSKESGEVDPRVAGERGSASPLVCQGHWHWRPAPGHQVRLRPRPSSVCCSLLSSLTRFSTSTSANSCLVVCSSICKSKLQYFLEFLHLVNVTRHSGYWPLLIFSKKKQPHYMLPLQRTRSRHDCNFIPGSPFLSAGNFLLVSPKLSLQPLLLFCLLSYPFSALLFLHDFNVVVDLKNLPRAKYTSKKLAKVWPNTNIGKVKTSHYFPAVELVIFGGLQDVLEISTQIKVEIEITVQNVDHFSTFEMSNLVS